MKQYQIEVGQIILPAWSLYSQHGTLEEALEEAEAIEEKMNEGAFRWSCYRILEVQIKEVFKYGS